MPWFIAPRPGALPHVVSKVHKGFVAPETPAPLGGRTLYLVIAPCTRKGCLVVEMPVSQTVDFDTSRCMLSGYAAYSRIIIPDDLHKQNNRRALKMLDFAIVFSVSSTWCLYPPLVEHKAS